MDTYLDTWPRESAAERCSYEERESKVVGYGHGRALSNDVAEKRRLKRWKRESDARRIFLRRSSSLIEYVRSNKIVWLVGKGRMRAWHCTLTFRCATGKEHRIWTPGKVMEYGNTGNTLRNTEENVISVSYGTNLC